MSRIAVIKKELCTDEVCGYMCQKVCPINRKGEDCIVTGSDKKPIINEELCIGCGICVHKCPVQCLSIINLPEALKNEPIHRYGQNGFHLYNLPIPIFGKVVGIVGRNGIGKSTAISVLAGTLKPNLGTDKEASWDDLIEFFKGTEAQIFFEKLKKGDITVSFKPQAVELIPKKIKGTVKELLSKVDEKGEMDKIAKELDLLQIMDNHIDKVSGGELQRVAIAATVLKKANLYIFDEPTSYLDIKQRIRVSKFIKNLANEDTAVLVVEHDLIILDYMADLVNLMYGKEGCYGIVSLPKTVKAGINIYLSGYLKDENMRFRDKAIKFMKRASFLEADNPVMVSWNGIKKTLGNFNLRADEGEIKKGHVIGIVGENGIGKTSFVKILANVIEADGTIEGDVKVSYKPQYLDKTDDLVRCLLHNAIENYNTQLIRPLNIEPLFDKQLDQLSGGELQRVAIAFCLSQEADLFLLDEPSAYLDVEQRLIISRVLKDFMEFKGTSALVVDHDLLFIDYIAQKLIVFDGKPAIEGFVKGPFSMEEGMNMFLNDLMITMRRDEESFRPRINKPGSQMDRKQRAEKKLYYG